MRHVSRCIHRRVTSDNHAPAFFIFYFSRNIFESAAVDLFSHSGKWYNFFFLLKKIDTEIEENFCLKSENESQLTIYFYFFVFIFYFWKVFSLKGINHRNGTSTAFETAVLRCKYYHYYEQSKSSSLKPRQYTIRSRRRKKKSGSHKWNWQNNYLRASMAIVEAKEVHWRVLSGVSALRRGASTDLLARQWHKPRDNG